jgi:hypothetical protein
MKTCGITSLNTSWEVRDVKRFVRFVSFELGMSFILSIRIQQQQHFVMGGDLRSQPQVQRQLRDIVAEVLQVKLGGSDEATVFA